MEPAADHEGPGGFGLDDAVKGCWISPARCTYPLAYYPEPGLLLGFMAMIRPANYGERAGLYMLEPYDPDRIPVILIDRLTSMAWAAGSPKCSCNDQARALGSSFPERCRSLYAKLPRCRPSLIQVHDERNVPAAGSPALCLWRISCKSARFRKKDF
jgi:hypothetical protein